MNKQLTETLIKVGLVIIVVIFIALLLIKRFVYFRPSSHFQTTQGAYKVVRHGHLHGWLLENNSDKIILLCHGNGGNISDRESKIRPLHNLGYSVLVFDYSGYGKSSGVPSEQQLYDDTSAMVALLRQNYNPDQIILYGESLGAPVATYAARRYSVGTLILEAPLPSMKVLIENKYPMGKLYSFLFPEFDTAAYLNGYRGKSLVMHSPTDEVIPYGSATHLFQMCTQHLQLDGSHNQPIIPWEQVRDFIESKL
jgi:pimeloyl-ACP methyl ester carboxylesterase